MIRKIKIQGNCPYCNSKDTVEFADFCYCNSNEPYAKNVPVCSKCHSDDIEIRKINNRRYKVVGRW